MMSNNFWHLLWIHNDIYLLLIFLPFSYSWTIHSNFANFLYFLFDSTDFKPNFPVMFFNVLISSIGLKKVNFFFLLDSFSQNISLMTNLGHLPQPLMRNKPISEYIIILFATFVVFSVLTLSTFYYRFCMDCRWLFSKSDIEFNGKIFNSIFFNLCFKDDKLYAIPNWFYAIVYYLSVDSLALSDASPSLFLVSPWSNLILICFLFSKLLDQSWQTGKYRGIGVFSFENQQPDD